MDDKKETRPSAEEYSPPTTIIFSSIETSLTKRQHKFVAAFFSVLAFFLLYQTRMCTELMGRMSTTYTDLNRNFNASRLLQQEVKKQAGETDVTNKCEEVVPNTDIFNKEGVNLSQRIKDSTKALCDDQKVSDNFPAFDLIPITETRADVVPLWKLDDSEARKKMRITEAGWVCSDDDSTLEPGAVTIREKLVSDVCKKRLRAKSVLPDTIRIESPQIPQVIESLKMTKNGVPTIALSRAAFSDDDTLKMTLLHEFMHVHGAPPYRPFLNFVHDDLTYLPEYNAMLRKAGFLDPWKFKWKQEAALWAMLTFLAAGILGNSYLAGWIVWPRNLRPVNGKRVPDKSEYGQDEDSEQQVAAESRRGFIVPLLFACISSVIILLGEVGGVFHSPSDTSWAVVFSATVSAILTILALIKDRREARRDKREAREAELKITLLERELEAVRGRLALPASDENHGQPD
jgi:hypothetical protein